MRRIVEKSLDRTRQKLFDLVQNRKASDRMNGAFDSVSVNQPSSRGYRKERYVDSYFGFFGLDCEHATDFARMIVGVAGLRQVYRSQIPKRGPLVFHRSQDV